MEWKVVNALNRDVERQHLNKILKEIESRINAVPAPPTQSEITRIVERVIVAEVPDALTHVTVNLAGDVSGSGSTDALGTIDIQVTLDPSKVGIGDAPFDNNFYWRINGSWQEVDSAIWGITYIDEPGVVVYTGGEGDGPPYRALPITGVEDEVVVANGDGQDLDLPSISVGLADLENTEEGVGPLKIYTRDSKGRIEGDEDATTDNLPEGEDNLYFTEERSHDATAGLLQNSDDIHFEYDENVPAVYAHLSDQVWDAISNVVNVVGTPTDADIIEFDETINGWVPKKNPRELLLDGGNF